MIDTLDAELVCKSFEREWALCQQAFDSSDDDLWSETRPPIDAGFADDDTKMRLRDAPSRWQAVSTQSRNVP